MTPQRRSLVALVALFGAAGVAVGYAYFGVFKVDEAEGERKAVADKLFSQPQEKQADGGGGAAPEFTRITVVAKRETTILERQPDGTWRMTAPVKGGVDQFTLDTMVGSLRDGKVEERIEEKPSEADLVRYGLKPPQWIVEAAAEMPDPANPSGPRVKKAIKLLGGIENTFDATAYLQRDSDPAVYAIGGATRLNFEKSSYDLRDKQVLSFDEAKVQSIDVVRRAKDGGYSLARAADGKSWALLKPKPMEADTQGINNALGQLKGERAVGFPADTPDGRKASGMDAPAVDATITLVGGDKVRIRVAKVGDAANAKVFALREDSTGAVLVELPATAVGHLDKSAAELRNKSVLKFNRDAVAEVAFKPQGGGPAISVKRSIPQGADAGVPSAEAWAVSAPEAGPAKAWKVSSNLWTLSALQATEYVEENPKSWEKYGINDKARQVVLAGADGKPVATLTIGSEVKGKQNRVYVRGTGNAALEMDTARLVDFPTKIDDVLERKTAPDAGTL